MLYVNQSRNAWMADIVKRRVISGGSMNQCGRWSDGTAYQIRNGICGSISSIWSSLTFDI
jgi:hypothetical protein